MRIHITLTPEEYNILFAISSSELRLPEHQVKWLIIQEAIRRGILPKKQGDEPDNRPPSDTTV